MKIKKNSVFSKVLSHLKKCWLIYVVSVVFAVLIVLLSIAVEKKVNHGLYIYSESGENYGKLVALNGNAKRAFSKNLQFAFYKFTDEQVKLIEDVYAENSTAALVVRLELKFPTSTKGIEKLDFSSPIPVSYGFLTNDDFSKSGKFLFSENSIFNSDHLIVQADAVEFYDLNFPSRTIDISFALSVDMNSGKVIVPPGFFIRSGLSCIIQSACVAPAIVGYDKSTEVPFWGFSSNGGRLQFNSTSFDFTGSSLIFPLYITSSNVPPVFDFLFSEKQAVDENSVESLEPDKNEFSFSFGGERIKVRRLLKTQVNSLSLQNPFSNMEVTGGKEGVLSVLLKGGDNKIIPENKFQLTEPIKSDPGLILYWPKNNWRNPDFELFEWDRFPGILIFDTRNYEVQSRFFARVAYFTEKDGYKGKILSNEQLKGKHDYNAHDYRAESLADFFNAFVDSSVTPNDEEILLLDILLKNGVIRPTDNKYSPYTAGKGAVVSISREIPSYNRKPLFTHEGFHALFFIDEDFQNFVAAIYGTIDRDTHDFLIDYFKSQLSLGYDTKDEFLMHTEFMSYILQQPVDRVAEYFLQKANRASVMKFTPVLSRKMRATGAIGFEDAAIVLDDYVRDKFNVECGDICLLGY